MNNTRILYTLYIILLFMHYVNKEKTPGVSRGSEKH